MIIVTKVKCFDDFSSCVFPKHLVMVPKSATFVAPSDRNIYIYIYIYTYQCEAPKIAKLVHITPMSLWFSWYL